MVRSLPPRLLSILILISLLILFLMVFSVIEILVVLVFKVFLMLVSKLLVLLLIRFSLGSLVSLVLVRIVGLLVNLPRSGSTRLILFLSYISRVTPKLNGGLVMFVYLRFMDKSESRTFRDVKQMIIRERSDETKVDFLDGDRFTYHPIDADIVYRSGNMETVVNIFDIEVE